MTLQILTIHRILADVQAKNLQATILFVDFTKAFDSLHERMMVQILLAYVLPNATVTAVMVLYRNTKVKVRSPDEDTDYYNYIFSALKLTGNYLSLNLLCI